jgi:type II secretory pathway pseudopilin PulG
VKRSQAGITLLEVVIAVSLLSLLIAGVMTALRIGVNALGRTNTRLMANRRVAGAQRVLQEQLAGFMPIVARYSANPELPPSTKAAFFQGEPDSMRFVSSYSLQEGARGIPRILEFQVIPGDKALGFRLVVNEHVYTGPASAGFFCLGPGPDRFLYRPIEVGPSSFVLADKLKFCRFSYQERAPNPKELVWTDVFRSLRWPTAVRIEMGPLDEDIARLRPVTVTAQMRVNRFAEFEYADYQ